MRKATLIKGLVTEDVVIHENQDDILTHEHFLSPNLARASNGDVLERAEPVTVRQHIVPIHRICREGRDDVYLIYSPKVEEVLGIPYRALLERAQEAEARAQEWADAEWKQRVLRINAEGKLEALHQFAIERANAPVWRRLWEALTGRPTRNMP
jgi:hypothetical protein